eukprot:SAG22_NODE_1405_length_4491_cov_3.141849_2_plen_41_part_01
MQPMHLSGPWSMISTILTVLQREEILLLVLYLVHRIDEFIT